MCLIIQCCIHQRAGSLHFLKKGQNRCTLLRRLPVFRLGWTSILRRLSGISWCFSRLRMFSPRLLLDRYSKTTDFLISRYRREIIYCKRAILSLSSSKILTPHPPLRQRRGVHTRRAERGMGGQYFGRRERWDCPLTVNNLSTADTHVNQEGV